MIYFVCVVRLGKTDTVTPTQTTCWKVCLLCHQTCSSASGSLPPVCSPRGTRRDQFLVSILPGDRWARVGTPFHCPWRVPVARSNTWRKDLTSLWHYIESVPKTSSPACSAAQSWRRGRWRRSLSCSSSGHPRPSEQQAVNKGPRASNWLVGEVSRWRLLVDWCRSGILCSTQAYEY